MIRIFTPPVSGGDIFPFAVELIAINAIFGGCFLILKRDGITKSQFLNPGRMLQCGNDEIMCIKPFE